MSASGVPLVRTRIEQSWGTPADAAGATHGRGVEAADGPPPTVGRIWRRREAHWRHLKLSKTRHREAATSSGVSEPARAAVVCVSEKPGPGANRSAPCAESLGRERRSSTTPGPAHRLFAASTWPPAGTTPSNGDTAPWSQKSSPDRPTASRLRRPRSATTRHPQTPDRACSAHPLHRTHPPAHLLPSRFSAHHPNSAAHTTHPPTSSFTLHPPLSPPSSYLMRGA